MKVRDLMTKDVVSVSPDTSLRDAAAVLTRHRISGLPVVDASGEVLGVVSETDIVTRASGRAQHGGLLAWLFDPEANGSRIQAQVVGEAMSAPPSTIAPTRPIHEAARKMTSDGVDRLPVVEHGKLVGILTRSDVVRAFTRDDSELAAEIRDDILLRTFWVEPGSITVTVSQGRVRLEGEVETEADTEMLPIFVSRVPGVVDVHAKLRARSAVA